MHGCAERALSCAHTPAGAAVGELPAAVPAVLQLQALRGHRAARPRQLQGWLVGWLCVWLRRHEACGAHGCACRAAALRSWPPTLLTLTTCGLQDGAFEDFPTCGWYHSLGQRVPDSQGFSCECESDLIWDTTFGTNTQRT